MTSTDLDLVEDGDDYILHVTDAAGQTTQTRLTGDQVLKLAQSARSLMGRILARRNPATAGTEAVLVTPVAQIELNDDSLTSEIHLTLIDQYGARLICGLPIQIAELLVDRLPKWIAGLKNQKPTEH